MKKNYLALLLLFSTISFTSCSDDEPTSEPTSSITSTITPSETSTSTKREFSIKKGKTNGNFVLKAYKTEPTTLTDPSFSVIKISISRGEEDINIYKEDFTATDGENNNLEAVSLITSLKGKTLVDAEGKNNRVPYVNATTEAVTLTESDTYIIVRVAFDSELSENTKLFYKGSEVNA